jgi:hypothetical protein
MFASPKIKGLIVLSALYSAQDSREKDSLRWEEGASHKESSKPFVSVISLGGKISLDAGPDPTIES